MNNTNKNHLFRKKHRVPTTRLKGWDYRRADDYFITICTKNHYCFFGHVMNGRVILNDLGAYARECMLNINKFSDSAKVANHVIMPNHAHAIIKLVGNNKHQEANRFGPLLKKSLSSVINHYKGRVTKFAKANKIQGWAWQPRFHDHIIRNFEDYQNCWNYIQNNPNQWREDRFYKNKSPS